MPQTNAHVILCSVLCFEEEDSQVRFDEGAQLLVLIKHRELVALPLPPGPSTSRSDSFQDLAPMRCDSQGNVERVGFALDRRYAAVQRSAVEIEFLSLHSLPSFSHVCVGGGSRSRWRILGFHWTGTPFSDFVVVTTTGVEFYQFFPEHKCLKLVKHLSQPVSWAHYSHEARLILLASGAQDNLIHGVQIQPQGILRIPKFEIKLAPMQDAPLAAGQRKLRRSLQASHVTVVRLYDMMFCVHIDPEVQQLNLYQLFKDLVVKKHTLQLFSSQVAVSVCDNLLLVHALDSKVVLLFDLMINSQSPVTAPLPLCVLAEEGFGAPYSPSWSFSSPNVVVDPQAGRVGRLGLDLHAIAASSIDKYCLLHFLLARSNSHRVIFEVLRKALEELEPLQSLSRMFTMINTPVAQLALETDVAAMLAANETSSTYALTTPTETSSVPAVQQARGALLSVTQASSVTASSTSGGALSETFLEPGDVSIGAQRRTALSREMLDNVFKPAVAKLPSSCDARNTARRYLIAAMTEFLHSQLHAGRPLDPELGMLLVSLLSQQGSFFQVHQLVQYHVLGDSLALVESLLEIEQCYPPATELAMDMMWRLGARTHGALVDRLLHKGDVLVACRAIRHLGLFGYPPAPILEAASKKDDPTVFSTAYAFLSLRNRSYRGSTAFLPEENCDGFTARYEELMRL